MCARRHVHHDYGRRLRLRQVEAWRGQCRQRHQKGVRGYRKWYREGPRTVARPGRRDPRVAELFATDHGPEPSLNWIAVHDEWGHVSCPLGGAPRKSRRVLAGREIRE